MTWRDGHAWHYLEERPNVHIKAEVGKGTRYDLCPSVVSVLAKLGNKNAGTPAVSDCKAGTCLYDLC